MAATSLRNRLRWMPRTRCTGSATTPANADNTLNASASPIVTPMVVSRLGDTGNHAVPEAAETGTEGEARDGGLLGRRGGDCGSQAHHAGRQLLECRGSHRNADRRGGQLRSRGSAPRVDGELVFQVATKVRIGHSPPGRLEHFAARGLDSRIAEHQLGKGIAGRFARSLAIRQSQQFGVDEPVDLTGDVRRQEDLPVAQPVGGPLPPGPPRQTAAEQQQHLRHGQQHIDGSTQEVPANGPPMQRERPAERKVVVDEMDDACARLVQVAADRTRNDFAGDGFVEGRGRGERVCGLGLGEWTHGRVTLCR